MPQKANGSSKQAASSGAAKKAAAVAREQEERERARRVAENKRADELANVKAEQMMHNAIQEADKCTYDSRFVGSAGFKLDNILLEFVKALGMREYLAGLKLTDNFRWSVSAASDHVLRIPDWETFAYPLSMFEPRYGREKLKSDRYNEFVACILKKELCMSVVATSSADKENTKKADEAKKKFIISFYIDKEVTNNDIFSYCINMDSLYEREPILRPVPKFNPVPLHHVSASDTNETPPVPTKEQKAAVYAQIRRGLVHSTLADVGEESDGKYKLRFDHYAAWMFHLEGSATIDTSDGGCFCIISVLWDGKTVGNEEKTTCKSYDEFLNWIRNHPPKAAATTLAAALERAVDRLLAVLAIE